MKINTTAVKSIARSHSAPAALRHPFRRTLIAMDELLFDLKRSAAADEYCFDQLTDIEDKLSQIKTLMMKQSDRR